MSDVKGPEDSSKNINKQPMQRPASPAASHMLWFFLLPALGFLGWASYYLVTNISNKTKESSLVEKAQSIQNGRSDGDRWKSAYALAEELLKKAKSGDYIRLPLEERKEILSALSKLLDQFKDDLRLKKYLILTLGSLNDPEALTLLKTNLKEKDEDIHFYSAWGYVGTLTANPDKITAVDLAEISSWLKNDDVSLKKVATSFLVQHGEEGVKSVVQALSDKDREVRWNAAVALSTVGRVEGLEQMSEIFDLNNLRSVGFRSAKDLEQLLKAAKVGALKLNNPTLNAKIAKLTKEANTETPEGKAIESALK